MDEEEYCDKVVAVLGDNNTYPCRLEPDHDGPCEPDLWDPIDETT